MKTKVVYKRLRTAWGYALINENKIELYQGLKKKKYAKKHLEVLIHEKLHLIFPDLDERAILKHGKELSEFLWQNKYRQLE